MLKHFLWCCLVLALLVLPGSRSHMAEILVDEDGPGGVHGNSIETYPSEDATPCYVTVKETRRVAGYCTKLGKNTRACAAGDMLDIFSPSCM